ncbi:MAG: heme ABC transporter permease [Bauldia sp.]|nr:heme ABC transporter permease [Bauldia sp.]
MTGRVLPWLWGATGIAIAIALYLGLFVAPADAVQGEVARILFIHPPAAWLAMGCYGVMSVAALGTLVWRHPLADVTQKAAAPIGAAFTLIGLVTGSIWGRPTWGTYWVWDARLTSFLILFIMYLGLIAVWRAVEDPGRAARAVSVLTLVGSINLPIIYFSVHWWNTLHQGASLITAEGTRIHPALLQALLAMMLGATLLFVSLLIAAMRTEILRRRVRSLRLSAAGAVS